MKKFVLVLMAFSITMAIKAQNDSTAKENKADTIKLGGTIIIRKKPEKDSSEKDSITISSHKKNGRITTNWFIVDLGFANYDDKSNYTLARGQGFVTQDINKESMKLRTGKSVNVNFWLFMQRLALIKKVVNLKYGLGMELNNYHFDEERIRLQKNPTVISLDNSYKDLKKNKLAADYLTIPMMLNFNFTPHQKSGFGLSAGVSAGYLYSARQKIKNDDDRQKIHDDFDLRKWKLSYIGELSLGPVKLYGSLALKSMWEKGLDQTPYAVGVRFSHF